MKLEIRLSSTYRGTCFVGVMKTKSCGLNRCLPFGRKKFVCRCFLSRTSFSIWFQLLFKLDYLFLCNDLFNKSLTFNIYSLISDWLGSSRSLTKGFLYESDRELSIQPNIMDNMYFQMSNYVSTIHQNTIGGKKSRFFHVYILLIGMWL